jgi:acyl carrier protein
MDTLDTRKTLAELAVREFNCDPDKISAQVPIKDLGIDSIGMLEFIFRIEEVFGIHIDNDQAEKLNSLADMAELVEQLRSTASTAAK